MEGAVQVIWEREDRTLALEGEPVLEYALSWPRIEGGGLGGTTPVWPAAGGGGGSGRPTGRPVWSWLSGAGTPGPSLPGVGS